MCFDDAAVVAFVVHAMTPQNCIYMALLPKEVKVGRVLTAFD